jgi:hypothetical protein
MFRLLGGAFLQRANRSHKGDTAVVPIPTEAA